MGVKSLWTLLTPVGRPVMLENVEGKAMAIDSSIWIYQFQATMRDKEGRALVNAHVLGFLRRISKLLFYGIKPVFVFDGGAPALKRKTLNDRKKKKSGAASSHIKIAEKLLAAQMRREALNHAQGAQEVRRTAKDKAPARDAPLDENTVYLEDIDGSGPRTPVKRIPLEPPSSSAKKNKFLDHDPYRLPKVDMEEVFLKATRSVEPDPRLATEDELRTFIEEMRPEDFDVNSPAFRELPTEIKYEIIGDLRLKSRQTSYARLQKMLQTSRTPLDFSKQQIQNLRQRNALTQQLLMTTDSIGSAHIAIPVRIAGERNKEYVLIKNEGESGGWVLGIKDIGTREKPIVLDHEQELMTEEDDSDADMEEVEVPATFTPDLDLRDYQREMALSGISTRHTPKRSQLLPARPINRKTKPHPLLNSNGDANESLDTVGLGRLNEDSDDDLIAYAIQQSLDDAAPPVPLLSPRGNTQPDSQTSSFFHLNSESLEESIYSDGPTRLETALSIANAGPSRGQPSPPKHGRLSSLFGRPVLLSPPSKESPAKVKAPFSTMEELSPSNHTPIRPPPSAIGSPFGGPGLLSFPTLRATEPDTMSDSDNEVEMVSSFTHKPSLGIEPKIDGSSNAEQGQSSMAVSSSRPTTSTPNETLESTKSDENMEEVLDAPITSSYRVEEIPDQAFALNTVLPSPNKPTPAYEPSEAITIPMNEEPADSVEETLFTWSRTPSPFGSRPPSPENVEGWDAAEEMDAHAEEGEFARFMSQVKGKDMDDMRKEIDDEIKHLNQQRKAAMRDSEDITQQMIAQIMAMLRLFGIPYITAPMEAEAQCAELVALSLVDGVITDDSDVFLFGARRVYKNMFNQSKTVECFLLTDLSRELGLDRDTLIQLAYLLGSDYTEGLPGVGPVVAMELLKEFPGHNGLHKFKDWWTKVQSGKDRDEDNQSKFRKQFKKKFKSLYLANDWPNSVIRDAYYHPTVDSSEEPFKWGMPDLDGLREFFHVELGWQKSKVDDLLLPIIQKMSKRNQTAALNKQGNLNEFLDISAGTGNYAPRHRQAYASKRLQQVITDFRKRQKSSSATPVPRAGSQDGGSDSASNDGDGDGAEETLTKKRKVAAATREKSKAKGKAKTARGSSPPTVKSRRGLKVRGRARKTKGRQDESEDDAVSDDFVQRQDATMGEPVIERDLRPRPKPRPTYKGAKDGSSIQPASEGRSSPDVQQIEAIP